MKQTHNYTSSQYVNEGGFPLSWMCRCCCGADQAKSGMREEADEYHVRNKTPAGTVIGRPVALGAYRGQSAMNYQSQSREPTTATETETTSETTQKP